LATHDPIIPQSAAAPEVTFEFEGRDGGRLAGVTASDGLRIRR
jgi:hypothetical protein